MLKNKLSVAVHFVWATWDRQPLITDEVARDLYRYMEAVCCDDKCEVLAIGGMPDHVHLLVLLSNTVTLADLVRHVKGSSSRFVSNCLRPGSWFAWQGSYGAFSVSQGNIPKIIAYIQNQKEHHALGTLYPNAEETNEIVLSVPAKAATGRPRPIRSNAAGIQRRILIPRSYAHHDHRTAKAEETASCTDRGSL